MKEKTGYFIKKDNFIFALFLYLLSGILLLKYYQYQINTDGVAYISIAQKYLQGDFNNAINGYWGPLISWLLVPFLHFGIPALLAVKILALITGFFTIIGVRLLSYRFEISHSIRNIVIFLLVPITLDFAFRVISPDLILLCFLVYYLNLIFSPNYPRRLSYGALCGVIGAFAYITKMYALVFFLAHFLLFNLFHYLKDTGSKKSILRNFIITLSVFLLISSPWVCLLSKKYKKITFGTTSKYTYANVGPKYKSQSISRHGFMEPPNETAISINEDPSCLEMKSWGPLYSWPEFKHQIKLLFENIYDLNFRFYQEFSFFSVTIIIAYLLLAAISFKKLILETNIIYPLVTLLSYPAGYIPLGLENRYLWINCILFILMGGQLINVLFRGRLFNTLKRRILIVFFALSFLATPLKNLINNFNIDKDIHNLSRILQAKNIKGDIASNSWWHMTLMLSYYLDSRYYGEAKEEMSGKEILDYLIKNKIDYYFVWDRHKLLPEFLSRYKKEVNVDIRGRDLAVYSLK